MSNDEKKVDFQINQRPVSISFECPNCESDVEINWDEIDTPDCWSDDWGEIECPYCHKILELGDYELD